MSVSDLNNDAKVTPVRPNFPGGPAGAEERRVQLVTNMELVLDEDWDDVLQGWIEEFIPEERAEAWGPPDTSINDLGDLSRQLTTPGLYGRAVVVRHQDEAALPLIDSGGPLDVAGVWPKMQQVQYKAVGLGDYFVGPHVDSKGRLSIHVRSPRNAHAKAHPKRPDEIQELWDLQLHSFKLPESEHQAWVWVKYRVDEDAPNDPAKTYYKAELARGLTGMQDTESFKAGADVSNVILGDDFKGARYPFKVDGRLVIPWVKYSSVDGGGVWNHLARRGAYHGTLNAGLLSTYTQQAARDATGTAVLTAGLVIPVDQVKTQSGTARTTRTVFVQPGGIIQAEFDPKAQGQQPFVKELGSGANITSLADYQARYSSRTLTRWGLNPSDVTRQSANPASAASLVVSDRGRRDYSRQMEPLFRRSDVRLIAMIAAFINRETASVYPESGYSVEYHQIPDSPAEERQKQDRWSWEINQGQLSPVGLYQRMHPGASEEDAMLALAAVEIEKRQLQALIKQGLEDKGIVDEASKSEIRVGEITSAIELAKATQIGDIAPDAAKAIASVMLGLSEDDAQSVTQSDPNAKPPQPAA